MNKTSTRAAGSTVERGLLPVVLLSLALVVAAVPALNVALPNLASDTGASLSELQWIVDAYALVFAALLLPAGAIGDRYGRRRTLIAGLSEFGAASLAARMVSASWGTGSNAVVGPAVTSDRPGRSPVARCDPSSRPGRRVG